MTSPSQSMVLNHPTGLFVLFFTEMWERFSYYGMRALLTLFLISDITEGGWAWTSEEAFELYGLYIGLVYFTPIFGGLLADKVLGYRKAIILGAALMTAGHASMAFETTFFFYLGLTLLVLGNGAFKPNISSIVGKLYPPNSEKKDGGYTIFYMGINAGAFLGMLLCGYIGENIGWSYGFGLAGIFMFFGMVQFWFGQGIFGNIGLTPNKGDDINPEVAKEKETNEEDTPKNVVRDRLIVIGILAFFSIFFWMAFEQAGASMTLFAKDFTQRTLEGSQALTFKVINTVITIIPLIIITWVLILLFKQTIKKYIISVFALGLSFVIIWGIALWMLITEFQSDAAEVPASWFGILNALFIVLLAPLFSKLWSSKYNPPASIKFALGLILLGLGFGVLAFGASSIESGASVASVSMMWLVVTYLIHTIGELVLSPVGLSYVSKLSPPKLVGLMFGVWFFSNFIAGILAGQSASYVEKISDEYSLSVFFLIFTIIPIVAGIVMALLTPYIKKKMHGIH